jgi:cyclic pyranopterin phosphate synthase
MKPLLDGFGRRVTYLRLSLTDRCNLRCFYCRPKEFRARPRNEILTFEEIERLARVAAALGVRKVRLTGGEPLVRPDVVDLVRRIAGIPGIDDLALSTNGTLLDALALPLRQAGLRRVNVSLDTLRPQTFRSVSGRDGLEGVIQGIDTAVLAGLRPVKLNVVVIRGVNDDELVEIVGFAQRIGAVARFIEYMPMTGDPRWTERHVSREEIVHRLGSLLSSAAPRVSGADPATYHALRHGSGVVGIISPITCRFCSLCNRLRLTADGRLRPCLTSLGEVDLKSAVRGGADDEDLAALFRAATAAKPLRGEYVNDRAPARPMVAIGG